MPGHSFIPQKLLRFIETKDFSRRWKALDLDDDALRSLQDAIRLGPESHPKVRGTGGLRKIRFADPRSNQGKSGSYRACYAYFSTRGIVFLTTIFAKSEKADLDSAEIKKIAEFIAAIEREFQSGEIP